MLFNQFVITMIFLTVLRAFTKGTAPEQQGLKNQGVGHSPTGNNNHFKTQQGTSNTIIKPKLISTQGENGRKLYKVERKPKNSSSMKETMTNNVMDRFQLDRETSSRVIFDEMNKRKNIRLGKQTSTLINNNGKSIDLSKPDIINNTQRKKQKSIDDEQNPKTIAMKNLKEEKGSRQAKRINSIINGQDGSLTNDQASKIIKHEIQRRKKARMRKPSESLIIDGRKIDTNNPKVFMKSNKNVKLEQ